MDELDQNDPMELAGAIERGDREAAFVALDVMIRDHTRVTSMREWIDIARRAARR